MYVNNHFSFFEIGNILLSGLGLNASSSGVKLGKRAREYPHQVIGLRISYGWAASRFYGPATRLAYSVRMARNSESRINPRRMALRIQDRSRRAKPGIHPGIN